MADVSIRFKAEAQQAQETIQNLRGKLAELNATLAEQKNRLIGATAEEQKNIRAQMAANTARKATLRSRIEQATLQKQAIAQLQKEAREQERAAQRQADARIASAERARDAEVAGFQRAAAAGRDYAEQLAEIATVSQRRAFVDIVERFQEQGVSFDEARAAAEPYIGVLSAVPPVLNAADAAYGRFTSTLINESERSADAIANLMRGVEALADGIGNRFDDLDVAGALERSILNEQRYFEQNPIGLTIEADQQRAGQQGRDFVNRLFSRQDQETERSEREAAREATEELREMASVVDSVVGELTRFEGDIGSLATRLGQFDISGLATGNPLSVATLPFQLYNAFTFDQRQAAARLPELNRQNREAFERGEFGIPTDLLEFGRERLGRATSLTDDPQLLALLEGLDPQIGRTTLDAVATIPDRILETIQSYTESVLVGLQAELDRASFNLQFARQTDGDVQGALQDVIQANTALYQTQIDSYNLQRLATGRAVGNVEELNRILNELNNQARLQIESTGNLITLSGIQARQRDARATAERTGTDRQAIEDVARAQYGEAAYDAEVAAALETVDSQPEVTEDITRIIEAVETRTANRFAQEALSTISETARDVNATETAILERWNETVPRIEAWWQELYEDIVNNPDLTEIERTEALAALGTQQDFVANLRAQYVTPVLNGIAQAAEALETRTANRLAQAAISAIGEATSDVNATEAEILEKWTDALPSLENWWTELYDDIINNPNVSDAQQAEELAALGSQQDFVSRLKSQYVTPVISGIRSSAEALETRTANRLAQEALGAISEAARDANVTASEIAQLWTDAVPLVESWYQELLDDANAIESDAERSEALAALGSPEQFIANLKSQYVTPILTGLQSGREALETRTANRVANEALNGLREATGDANITEQAVLALWTDAVPLIENWYQELFEDANAIENAAERAEAVAALGTPEAFIANLKSQYVTPIITGLQSAQEALETRTANRVAQGALSGLREAANDVNITEAEIIEVWTAAVPLLTDWYQELLDDANAIENDTERAEAITALGSPDQFVANLKSQYVTPVLTGIAQSTEALETRTANRRANTAIEGLREVASDVNLTEQAILDKWQEAVPFIRTWWTELHDDIVNNARLSDADIGEALAELGSVESFIGNIRSQYVTPVLNNILQTRFSNRSARARTGVDRAQFNLGGATSESEFERRRDALIEAIHAYHDAEEERISSLKVSEAELEQLRSANALQRDQALHSATQATNTFEAERISAAENAAAERLRAEERLQADIQDLRDDAFDAEQDHADRVLSINERLQDQITDVHARALQQREDNERRTNRAIEDVQRDFSRDIEDILRGAGADDALFRHGDFQRILSVAGLEDQSRLRQFLGTAGINLSDEAFAQIGELGRERQRDIADIQRDQANRLADIQIEQDRAINDAEQARSDALIASQDRLSEEQLNLTTEISELRTALIELGIGDFVGTTGSVDSFATLTDILGVEDGLTRKELTNFLQNALTDGAFSDLGTLYDTPSDALSALQQRILFQDENVRTRPTGQLTPESAEQFLQAASSFLALPTGNPLIQAQPEGLIEQGLIAPRDSQSFMIENAEIKANTVNLSGNINGGGGSQQPIQSGPTTVIVNLDTEETTRFLDEQLVRLDADNRSVGSYQRGS